MDGLELTDDDGKTAFIMACETGNFQAAKLLVKAGTKVHAKVRPYLHLHPVPC